MRNTSTRLALAATFLLCALSACPKDAVPPSVPDTFVGSHPTEEYVSPGVVTTWDPLRTNDGLTIVVDATQDIMFVIDMDGEVIRAFPVWDEEFPVFDYAKPLDGGLLATYPRISPEPDLGNPLNRQRKFFVLDVTDGQQLYDWFGAPILQLIHHDYHLLENGNYLILASPYPFSHWSNISVANVRDDVIFELDPITGEIVWY
ncbi:MAG: aryl-sulfate sulfotransferase [Chrysiogenetes bacterium]|nr:aryl-sulfate sulfotransferase [Chrysiogenetes bacterium]